MAICIWQSPEQSSVAQLGKEYGCNRLMEKNVLQGRKFIPTQEVIYGSARICIQLVFSIVYVHVKGNFDEFMFGRGDCL